MDARTFLDNFGTIADAPSGVDRLRELVLDLAVRGQLVPQDAADGDAIDLLDQATVVKKQLVRTGEVPKSRPLPDDDSGVGDIVFTIPPTWIWTRLDDVAVYIQRGKGPTYVENSGVPVVSQKCIQNSGFDLAKARFVDEATLASYGTERFLREGDLLWNSTGTGTVGRVNVFPGSDAYDHVVADSHVTVVRTAVCSPRYLHCWLSSPEVQSTIEDRTTGTTKQQELNTSTVRLQPVPLPPRAEQERIVAKVDELMQLCDDLEARQQARRHITTRLRASSLDALTNAETDDDLHTAWSRIHTNWEALTDHPDSIDALRQTILQLAVRGRLVGQLSTEEHPTVALARCADERNKLVSEGRFRKQGSVADPVEEPFEVPDRWAWTQIDDCFLVTGGIQKSGKRRPAGNSFPYLRVANVQRGRLDLAEIAEFELFDGELERYQLEPGDLLVVEGNGSESEIGRCARWSGEIDHCVHQNHLIRCRPLDRDLEGFTLLYLNSPTGTAVMRRLAVTTSGLYNLSVGKIRAISMPLPPREEQQRIASRVGELMSLCDSLEQALAKGSQAREALAASTNRILVSS